jgi:hypothetical protein
MPVQFYNVKSRAKVDIDDEKVKKVKYARTGKDGSVQYRYAFRAVDESTGTNLTKFVSQETWDAHPGEEEALDPK